MSGAEAFNWLGSEYTSNCEIEGLENIPKNSKCLLVANHPMGAERYRYIIRYTKYAKMYSFLLMNSLSIYLDHSKTLWLQLCE